MPQSQSPPTETNITSGRSSPTLSTYSSSSHFKPQPMQPFPLNINLINDTSMNQAQFKEQLQLHVQTIGILVAEKTELQSKLQQQVKKSDKKQDECDELTGRLKASRQKINDLEKLIQQLGQQQNQTESSNLINNQNQTEMGKLIGEINSKDLFIDELRIRLDESNEKLSLKQQETQKLAQLTLDLKSQLEIMQLKMSQITNSIEHEEGQQPPQIDIIQQDEIYKLKELNLSLETKLDETNQKMDKQKEDLKTEYQNYVDRLQKQVESLVDQINRMTDEREDAFSKIDKLESVLAASNKKNEKLSQEIDELSAKLSEKDQVSPRLANNEQMSKIDLLEHEIRYFKQQIEILLHEQSSFKSVIDDKDQSITNLSKLLENFESDREKFNTLLEQTHNDKQTISRILKQNNDLKDQLTELQDAYVTVTKANLDLATQLQTEQFKLKTVENVEEVKTGEQVPSSEWGDDENGENQANLNKDDTSKNDTLLDSIKKRIEDLEKENKDLNDYISLMNLEKEKQAELIDSLRDKIVSLESIQVATNSGIKADFSEEHLNNMKLLEVSVFLVLIIIIDFLNVIYNW